MAYKIVVSNGELSSGIILNNQDSMTVLDGGIATVTTLNYWSNILVSSGGTVNSTTLSGGAMSVSSGGVANDTTAVSLDRITVLSGGIMNNTILAPPDKGSNEMIVVYGAVASNTTVDSRGSLKIGGLAQDAIINMGGTLDVSSGGTALNVVENGGYVKFDDNATVTFAPYTFSGLDLTHVSGTIHSGTTAVNTIVNSSGVLRVFNGGIASNTTVLSSGYLHISSGGVATQTTLLGAALYISNNGVADFTTISSGGSMRVNESGMANSTTVNSSGYLLIFAGTANITTINSGGYMDISSGGIAKDVLENGGYVNVAKEADVTFVSNTLSCLDIRNDSATIHSGTTANSTTINSRGYMSIFSSGIASNTTIYGSGVLSISSGGITKDVKTYAGGTLKIANGGNITGKMSFLAGAVVSVEDGAIIDFDLSQTMTNDKALLSDWSLIQGTPDYTLTVNEKQDTGIYTLADAADDFDGTITVQNTVGESLGTLALGQTTKIGDADYTLTVADSSLTVTIGTIEPVIPSSPTGLRAFIDGQDVALVWNASTDDTSGIKEYVVTYSLDGQDFTVRTINTNYVLKDTDFGSYSWTVQAVDFAGNESAIIAGDAFTVSGFKPYTVEYSPDNFEHVITFAVTTPSLDAFRMPDGIYQMRVRQEGSNEWITGDPIVAEDTGDAPQLIKSEADGNADVFFANSIGTWESGYLAQHTGSIGDWGGTNEYAGLYGKNKLADIIEGSDDANILLMSDDENGDSLFVDDIYTDLPGSIAEQQARIARIDEIRAGAGNDIVDMTSQRFEYVGDGLTIRGGAGNDVIWANKGDNRLFGDAGNDRIVGASGNDVIAGGIGNDRMHGGGGNDVFTFCNNWGTDNVDQLAGGSVTLWFASGSMENWDAETLTYMDGENSVKVSGVALDKITLKFSDDGSAQFASLTSMGAFLDATTERIFEESGKGILASLGGGASTAAVPG